MVVSLENLFEIQTEALELLYSKLPVTRLPVKVWETLLENISLCASLAWIMSLSPVFSFIFL